MERREEQSDAVLNAGASCRAETVEGLSRFLSSEFAQATDEILRELARARRQAALGELALSVVHEIKNPLCGLTLSVEVLQSKVDPNDSRMTLLNNVRREAERMERIVEDLLLFARRTTAAPASGEASISTSPLPLEDIVRRSIEAARSTLERAGVGLALRYASADCDIEADPDLLQMLIRNILLSLPLSPGSSGRSEISVYVLSLEQAEACVVFKGDVAGIAAGDLGGIFRAADPRATPGRCGLEVIARRIMEVHHGRAEVSGESGRGTTYSLIFPRVNQTRSLVERRVRQAESADGQPAPADAPPARTPAMAADSASWR